MSLKPHFSRFLGAHPQRLNFCAHSLHPWPDVSFDAQQQAWIDAAEQLETRWTRLFSERVPEAQHHLARILNLPDPASLCFGGNTHEFLVRLLSGVESRPFRVLTTDGEFLSVSRQLARLVEAGHCTVETVPVEPFENFPGRFAAAARAGGHHLIYFSQVFYNSGYWVEDLASLVAAVPSSRSLIVIDGYHGFMAVPTDLSRLAHRVFYLAGGHKYGMAGEGVAFLHSPPGQVPRPLLTGWLASFGALERAADEQIHYPADGGRFWGATFDPTALYRLTAVMDWVRRYQITVQRLHAQISDLQRELLEGLDRRGHPVLNRMHLLPPTGQRRGNFLSFRHPGASAVQQALADVGVLTDVRADRLRVGLGLYHDSTDVAELLRRIDQSGRNDRSRV